MDGIIKAMNKITKTALPKTAKTKQKKALPPIFAKAKIIDVIIKPIPFLEFDCCTTGSG